MVSPKDLNADKEFVDDFNKSLEEDLLKEMTDDSVHRDIQVKDPNASQNESASEKIQANVNASSQSRSLLREVSVKEEIKSPTNRSNDVKK